MIPWGKYLSWKLLFFLQITPKCPICFHFPPCGIMYPEPIAKLPVLLGYHAVSNMFPIASLWKRTPLH